MSDGLYSLQALFLRIAGNDSSPAKLKKLVSKALKVLPSDGTPEMASFAGVLRGTLALHTSLGGVFKDFTAFVKVVEEISRRAQCSQTLHRFL